MKISNNDVYLAELEQAYGRTFDQDLLSKFMHPDARAPRVASIDYRGAESARRSEGASRDGDGDEEAESASALPNPGAENSKGSWSGPAGAKRDRWNASAQAKMPFPRKPRFAWTDASQLLPLSVFPGRADYP